MALCPLDRAILEEVTNTPIAEGETVLRCPTHGGYYMAYGLHLLPVPRAVASNPPPGNNRAINMYRSPANEIVMVHDAGTVTISGGAAGAHNVLSATHTDSFGADTPADNDVLKYDTPNTRWEAAPIDHTELSGITADQHHTQSHNHSAVGDGQTLSPVTLNVPNAAAPVPTAEGEMHWDSDDNKLVIGDGVGQRHIVPTASVSGDATMSTAGAVTVAATHSGSAHHAQSHGNADHTVGVAPADVTKAAAAEGTQVAIARADHKHDISTTVVGGSTFGDVAAEGTATSLARSDHLHGREANPITAHEAAGDPHTSYRLESADHSHQSTGLQAGQIDHGLAITGLTDDDHTQYLKEEASGGLASEVPDHTHSGVAEAGTVSHTVLTDITTDQHHAQSHNHSAVGDGQDLQPNNVNLGGGDTTLTIATGQITRTRFYHSIDTQAAAASDELAGIAGVADGLLLLIRPTNDARTVIVKHEGVEEGTATNRINLNGDTDLTLDDQDDFLLLIYDTGIGRWIEIARGSSLHADLTGVTANQHHAQAHVINGADHTLTGGTDDQFLRATGATTFAFEAIPFSAGGTLLDPTALRNVIIWRAPFPCTVTNVRGYRVGGTGATINARLNGASNHLASALSLTSADTWMDGGAVQNTAYAAGDKLEIMLVTVSGTPTEIAIQVDFTRP